MPKTFDITIGEELLDGLYDYFHEGINDYGEEMEPDMLANAISARDQIVAAINVRDGESNDL